ncbi:MAG: zinc-binding dehydrogenase [Cyclobacteriaceae bacterium]
MKAIQYSGGNESIALLEIDVPIPGDGECLIQLKASALNRRDQWIREGLYPGIKPGVTLGSDGAGIVIKGPSQWMNKEVIVNPNQSWGPNDRAQRTDYTILGMPHHGTLSEFITVPVDRLAEKPGHLNWEQAAGLPLAGMTAYRALFYRGRLKPENRVLVTGIGGGVSQFALQFALSHGCKVFVTSGNQDKIDRACDLGAAKGFNYHDDDWANQLSSQGKVDLVIDSAAGASLNEYLSIVNPGGKIVIYGGTTGKTPDFDIRKLFWQQIDVLGSTMASDDQFLEMVDFVNKNQITPTIDRVFTTSNYLEAFDRFKAHDHLGKIVITWEP